MKKQLTRSITVLMCSLMLLNQPVKSNAINPDDFSAEMAVVWNQKVMEMAVAEDGLFTLKGLRTLSMMHVAMHDALNAIAPLFSKYSNIRNEPSADPVASAAQAAYQVAISQYPDKAQQLNEELKKWLGMVKESKNKTLGIRLGKEAASAILIARDNDQWDGEAEYTWHPMGPGVYAEFNQHSGTPEGFIFGAGWAVAKPFMLPSQDYFRSPPPPEINSDEYTKAFNEVKEYGRFQSNSRTADQTHFAMWWKDFVENSHNRLARQLVMKENLNLWQATRSFALMNMSIYDAYINVFENKFFYNHWRPYTAIRWAENDGNPDTEPEPDWNNLHKHTYAFPSYPSAHGTVSAAAMTILANTLGDGDNYTFTMTIAEVDKAGPMSGKIKTNPPTRTFNNFSEAAMECSMSRVYLGIHFRYDSEEGNKLGTKVGNYALVNFLKSKD